MALLETIQPACFDNTHSAPDLALPPAPATTAGAGAGARRPTVAAEAAAAAAAVGDLAAHPTLPPISPLFPALILAAATPPWPVVPDALPPPPPSAEEGLAHALAACIANRCPAYAGGPPLAPVPARAPASRSPLRLPLPPLLLLPTAVAAAAAFRSHQPTSMA